MTTPCPHELVQTVNRRWDCLQAIVSEPQEKRDLVETLDTPRSTLDAIVRELERAGLVSYRDGRWQATITGRSAAQTYAECVESLASIHAARAVLEPLDSTTDLPAEVLDGAETFEATGPVPDAVLVEFLDRIAAVDQLRGVAPRALSGYTDRVFQTAVNNDSTLELILADSVFSQLSSIDPETVADRLTHERFSVYHGPVPTTFGFWLGESPDHMGIIVYADRGIHGLLINDSPAAVDWATEQYESVMAGAEPVDGLL